MEDVSIHEPISLDHIYGLTKEVILVLYNLLTGEHFLTGQEVGHQFSLCQYNTRRT